jgi:dTDP-4-amino-4,6-dideoxygalactose transaminase
VLAGYTPVFCDIDVNTFNLDPNKVRESITSKTRAICAVDIFGLPADWPELRRVADEFNLKLVADSAQAPSARIDGKLPVAFADAGGYSFNRHKHLQTGEGGIAVTNDKKLSDRMRALRNHGEVAAPEVTLDNDVLIGHNWRLGEFEALIATLQLGRFEQLIDSRRVAANKLIERLGMLEGITIPKCPDSSTHDYYILGMHFDSRVAGFNRDFLISALQAEGVDFIIGEYCQLHRLPAFRNYRATDLSITEELNEEKFLGLYLCGYEFADQLIHEIVLAFEKIWKFAKRT